MPIAPSNWQTLRDWISEHLTTCPVCEGYDWDLQEPFMWQVEQHMSSLMRPRVEGDRVLIVVSLTCQTCKLVLFFNAAAIFSYLGMGVDEPQNPVR